MNLQVVPGSAEDRFSLAPLRAEAWRDALSIEQYALRNRRLYEHPFGRHIETYTLRDGDRIVASLDVLPIRLQVLRESCDAFHIASVITPPDQRGRGHASRLLQWFFDEHADRAGVLYSDIGPAFYERFGFTARPTTQVTVPAGGDARLQGERLSLSAFVATINDLRRATLAASGRPAASLLLTDEWLDWHLERYRFFAELAGKRLADTLFWRLTHQDSEHPLAVVPDFLASRLELMWKYPGCRECEAVGRGEAARLGLKDVRFWETDPVRAGEKECPMVRVPSLGASVLFSDPQLLDWW